MDKAFEKEMKDGCALTEPSVTLGLPFRGDETLQGVPVSSRSPW